MKQIIYSLGIIAALTSCTVQQKIAHKLHKADKLMNEARALGAFVKTDSIKSEIKTETPIEAESAGFTINPSKDTTSFNITIAKNDSLVLVIDSLSKKINSGSATAEQSTELQKAKTENQVLKKRLEQGFIPNSIYNYKIDSVTDVSVSFKDGLVAWQLHRQATKAKGKVEVTTAINQTIECPPVDHTWRTIALTLAAILALSILIMTKKIAI